MPAEDKKKAVVVKKQELLALRVPCPLCKSITAEGQKVPTMLPEKLCPKCGYMDERLTLQHQIFADHFLENKHKGKAYLAAGYEAKDVATASRFASILIQKPSIANYILRRQRELAEKAKITQEELVMAATHAVRFDPRKFFDEEGRLKEVVALDEQSAKSLAGMDVEVVYEGREDKRIAVGEIRKFKFADRLKAIEILMRYFGGMFNANNLPQGGTTINDNRIVTHVYVVPAFNSTVAIPSSHHALNPPKDNNNGHGGNGQNHS